MTAKSIKKTVLILAACVLTACSNSGGNGKEAEQSASQAIASASAQAAETATDSSEQNTGSDGGSGTAKSTDAKANEEIAWPDIGGEVILEADDVRLYLQSVSFEEEPAGALETPYLKIKGTLVNRNRTKTYDLCSINDLPIRMRYMDTGDMRILVGAKDVQGNYLETVSVKPGEETGFEMLFDWAFSYYSGSPQSQVVFEKNFERVVLRMCFGIMKKGDYKPNEYPSNLFLSDAYAVTLDQGGDFAIQTMGGFGIECHDIQGLQDVCARYLRIRADGFGGFIRGDNFIMQTTEDGRLLHLHVPFSMFQNKTGQDDMLSFAQEVIPLIFADAETVQTVLDFCEEANVSGGNHRLLVDGCLMEFYPQMLDIFPLPLTAEEEQKINLE